MSPHADKSLWYLLGFSGGKDSVATYLYLTRVLGLLNVIATFADTGHEADDTYDYITMLRREHGFDIRLTPPTLEDIRGELTPWKIAERLGLLAIGITPSHPSFWHQPLTMERLSIVKRRFPSTTVRFCTTHLKLFPQRRWMRHWAEWNDVPLSQVVRVSGVRAEESEDRAKRPEWLDNDEFMGVPLWLPIHKWTWQEVFAIHDRFGVPVNPLYKQGCGRVGCFPCIMAKKAELTALAERRPDAFDNLTGMEGRVADAVGKPVMTFFSNTKAPKRFASTTCSSTGKPIQTAEDIRRWALGDDPADEGQGVMFEEDWTEDVTSCLSQYGLCE